MNPQLTVALIGALVALMGHLLWNVLDRWRTLRLKETEFKITRYQEFLFAVSAGSSKDYETQLNFVKSLNVIDLMGSMGVLKEIKTLVDNYNSPKGSVAAQWEIINRIIFQMRCDVRGKRGAKAFSKFEFPIIVPDKDPDDSQAKAPRAKSK